MAPTISDKVRPRPVAISFSPFQKASSRLTLVLWPAMTIERLTTGDFIDLLHFRSGERRGPAWLYCPATRRADVQPWTSRSAPGVRLHAAQPADVQFVSGRPSG